MFTLPLVVLLSLFQVGLCMIGGMSGLSYLPRFMQACGRGFTNSFQPCSPQTSGSFDPFGWGRQAQTRPPPRPQPPAYPYRYPYPQQQQRYQYPPQQYQYPHQQYQYPPAQPGAYPYGYPGYPPKPAQTPKRVRRAVPSQQQQQQQQQTQQQRYQYPPRYYYPAPPAAQPPPPPPPQPTVYPATACRDAAMMTLMMNSDAPSMFSPGARRFQSRAKCLPIPRQVNQVLQQWGMGDFPGVCCIPKMPTTP